MGPEQPLPLPAEFTDVDEYVDSLLEFGTSSWLLQTLCGGVHILDFFTREPPLYPLILPQEWRDWFKSREIMEILDLFMREDLDQFKGLENGEREWRGGLAPPKGLIQYLKDVRRHLLTRDFPPKGSRLDAGATKQPKMARHVALGMKVKKIHEVDNFSRYVDRLTADIAASKHREVTHIADFGSGQNYLGRALASQPYNRHIIAIESRHHNIEGAMNMDVLAKLVERPKTIVNKKEWRAKMAAAMAENEAFNEKEWRAQMTASMTATEDCGPDGCPPVPETGSPSNGERAWAKGERIHCNSNQIPAASPERKTAKLHTFTGGQGTIQYIEHRIEDGNLEPVIDQIVNTSEVEECNENTSSEDSEQKSSAFTTQEEVSLTAPLPKANSPNLMVISLHSCGNLLHHGLRSLVLNPNVSAVALIGCCYNLLTERLGPPTYKLPSLRPNHPRLEATSSTFDPHGFPMSDHLCNYQHQHGTGVRLNITARMMAVQAPQNWGEEDSGGFFKRHFFRALLQRIFLDRGVVPAPKHEDAGGVSPAGTGIGREGGTAPIIIGNLRKSYYKDFVTYVRGALVKIEQMDPERGEWINEKMKGLTDEDILDYEERYKEKKKELSVMWSLMAFSAGVVEAMIVVDRWLWLREQKEVAECWVEPVFDYKLSPRNLVVVGLKR